MTEKELLTDAFCDRAPGPSDARQAYVIHYDRETKGFGLRVTRKEAKSFVLNYRNAAGEDRRYTIGTFRDPWRAAAARKEALRLKMLVDQGKDPQGDKHAIRSAPTVNELVEYWRKEHAPRKRERSRIEDERLIAQWIGPALGARKVGDLDNAKIKAFHRKITEHGTPTRANRALALLSKMFSLARHDLKWCADNPCSSVTHNDEEPRERYLTKDELGRLTEALAAHPNRAAADAIRMLLLTGARKGEVLRATWSQFNLDEGIWTKPSSHTKTKKTHVVPLSEAARELLAGIARTSPLVFPGVRGFLFTDWAKLCKAAGIEGVRIHDLRHTYASVLVNAGASLPQIGALLGHVLSQTTQRYSHHFQDPLRALTEDASVTIMKPRQARG